MYDDRMFHFLSLLAELHVDPAVSNPANILEIPDDERSEGEGRPQFPQDDLKHNGNWPGLYKDVGLFTEQEWSLLMCKCLASMGRFFFFAVGEISFFLTDCDISNTSGRCWFVNDRSPR
jgi:hypothetical protein